MIIKSNTRENISKVLKELERDIETTQKKATKILQLNKNMFRLHINSVTSESEDYLKSENKWNQINQKLKTLNQIKSILENHEKGSGSENDLESLNKELTKYIDKAKEKKLYVIEKTFKYYRMEIFKEDSEIEKLIKLKIKQNNNSQYIKETFIRSCLKLDASIFEPLIDEDQYFEELDKYRFLQSMKEQFDYLKGIGLKKVQLVIGTCKMCFTGEKVYEFYKQPKKGKPAFAYNIQEKDGKIKDIFRCNYSDGYESDSRNKKNSDITYLF